MRCNSCGADVLDQAAFCHKCGKPMGQPAAAPAGIGGALKPPVAHEAEPEKVIWEGTYSPKAMLGTAVAFGLISLAILVGGVIFVFALPLVIAVAVLIWLWPLGQLVYRRLSVHYRLTNQRLFHERGILTHVTDRIEVIDMDDITTEQGLVERMLGIGSLRITSSDATNPKLLLQGIDDVNRVASLIDDARRAERNRRGVYIESV